MVLFVNLCLDINLAIRVLPMYLWCIQYRLEYKFANPPCKRLIVRGYIPHFRMSKVLPDARLWISLFRDIVFIESLNMHSSFSCTVSFRTISMQWPHDRTIHDLKVHFEINDNQLENGQPSSAALAKPAPSVSFHVHNASPSWLPRLSATAPDFVTSWIPLNIFHLNVEISFIIWDF